MKKIKTTIFIGLASLLLMTYSCDRTKSANYKPSEIVATGSATYYSVSAVDYYSSGIHYKVFNSANGDIFVVNITRDSIDIKSKINVTF